MEPLCAKRPGAAPHPGYALTFLRSPPHEIACSTGAQLNAYRPFRARSIRTNVARPDSGAPVEAALNPAATPPSSSPAPARTPARFGSERHDASAQPPQLAAKAPAHEAGG